MAKTEYWTQPHCSFGSIQEVSGVRLALSGRKARKACGADLGREAELNVHAMPEHHRPHSSDADLSHLDHLPASTEHVLPFLPSDYFHKHLRNLSFTNHIFDTQVLDNYGAAAYIVLKCVEHHIIKYHLQMSPCAATAWLFTLSLGRLHCFSVSGRNI